MGTELEHVWCPQESEAKLPEQSYLQYLELSVFDDGRETSAGCYPTMIKPLAVQRSPHYTLQTTVWTSVFTYETLVSNHSLVLCQSSHSDPRSTYVLLLAQAHTSFTTEVNSNSFFFFLSIIKSIVKFYSIPPVPIFPGPFKCSGCITEVKLWSAGISVLGVICWVTLLFPAL